MPQKSIQIKRIYEEYSDADGYRILVDRLWPRGISKANAKIELWSKDVAPSNDLRKWYSHNLKKAKQFEAKYIKELEGNLEALNNFKENIVDRKTITLLYASKDANPIHAMVLKQFLTK